MYSFTNKSRRLTAFIMAIVIMLCNESLVGIAKAEDAKTTFSNVILIARFADDNTDLYNQPYMYNSSYTAWQMKKRDFNKSVAGVPDSYGSQNSMERYIDIVSNGQCKLNNVFPQENTDGKTFAIITLDKRYSEYDNDHLQIMKACVDKANQMFPTLSLNGADSNNDGYLDNLSIIMQVDSSHVITSQSDALWPKKFHNDYVNLQLGGKYINTVNILNTNNCAAAVCCHEFLHSMGLPDLYRYDDNGTPVGVWDIMAQTTPSMQYPLAWQRQNLGWTSLEEISQSQTVTLYEPYSNQGEQAYILKSPLSDKEFFVVEYRKKSSDRIAGVDSRIPGSGVIIYRVNLTVDGLSNAADNDYIYVFRPNETGLKTSQGDITSAYLNANPTTNGGISTFGNSDLKASIKDNAICYSNGYNSGIVVNAVSSDDSSVTLSITYPENTDSNNWDVVDTSKVNKSDVSVAKMAISADHSIYTIHTDYNNKAYIQKCTNGLWVDVAKTINDVYNPSIQILNNKPYIMYADYVNSPSVHVSTLDESGNNWVDVVNISTGSSWSNMPQLVKTSDGSVYGIYDIDSQTTKVFKLSANNTVQQIGNEITTSYITGSTIDVIGNETYVMASDAFNGGKAFLYRLDANNTWQAVSGISLDGVTNRHKLAAGEDGCFYALRYNSESIFLDSYNRTGIDMNGYASLNMTAIDISTINTALGGRYINSADVIVFDGYIYVAVADDAGVVDVYQIAEKDKSAITMVGENLYVPTNEVTLLEDNQVIYALLYDQSGEGDFAIRSKDFRKIEDDPLGDFVNRMYTIVLNREPEENGFNVWKQWLVSGEHTGAQMITAFLESKEFVARNLTDEEFCAICYKAMMGRDADEEGLNIWLSVLHNGVSNRFVISNFVASIEFTDICTSYGIVKGSVILEEARDLNYNVTSFVSRCYKTVLYRDADAEGLNAWCDALQQGLVTPAQVAHEFVFSPEAVAQNLSDSQYVERLYKTFMGRECESEDTKNMWATYVEEHSRQDAFELFAGSVEFAEIVRSYGL